MRSPRSVTMQPIGMFSRSLKFAIAFLDLVTTGFWPVIAVSSATAESIILAFWIASPRPMLSTIFSSRGTWFTFVVAHLLHQSGGRRRFDSVRAGGRHDSGARPVVRRSGGRRARCGHPRAARLPMRTGALHLSHMIMRFESGSTLPSRRCRRGSAARAASVALHHVEPLDQRALLVGEHAQDLAGLAALAAGDDHHRIVLA